MTAATAVVAAAAAAAVFVGFVFMLGDSRRSRNSITAGAGKCYAGERAAGCAADMRMHIRLEAKASGSMKPDMDTIRSPVIGSMNAARQLLGAASSRSCSEPDINVEVRPIIGHIIHTGWNNC